MSRAKQPGCLSMLIGLGLLLVFGVVLFGGSSAPPDAGPSATPAGSVSTKPAPAKPDRTRQPKAPEPSAPIGDSELAFVDIAQAKRVLPQLPVKGRAPLTDYSREAFGTPWSDANDNRCDTRNDILRRDLTRKVVVDCVVLSGILDEPYSGERVVFTRGPVTSLEVQIDHVVAMANAWQTGAKFWSDDKRERFANDRRNLLAVRGDLNLQKSDADAATWLPPRKAFRCTYVAMQVLTKDRYGLWLTAPEKAAITRILQNC